MVKFKRPNHIFFPSFLFMCLNLVSSNSKEREQKMRKKESREKRELHLIFGFINPVAENLSFPEIERSDRRDIWSAASQQLRQRFGRLDRRFEVWRSGFRAVLHSNVFGDIFLIFVLF